MKVVSIEEIRRIELDMLAYVDQLCRDNDIQYSLIGGSLLGSVRHKGFIPWDDDVDIMLRRPEYEKLIALLKESDQYDLWHYTTKVTSQPYAKLCDKKTYQANAKTDFLWPHIGVNMDIFPYDNLPLEEADRVQFIKQAHSKFENLYSTDFPMYISGTKWYYSLARLFLRLPRFLKYHGKNAEVAKDADDFMQTYNDMDVKEMGYLGSRYFQKEHFPKDIFYETEDVQFEGQTVRKIVNHDAYLSQLFGDYMQLPPENQRDNHSYVTFAWKEDNK
jgi:lipopolysaccharide cholinephosphotransferase